RHSTLRMRLALLLLCIVALGHSFYLSNYYYTPRNTWESPAVKSEENEMNGDGQMIPKAKRLKPCFYSPIQCMLRRK
ncbi:hypothetical protein PMAYCL1PPCAC_18632, partial [Pristionchus mayeri]